LNKIKSRKPEQRYKDRSNVFIPPFRFNFLTPFYDFMMKWAARESTFKLRLVEQARIEKGHRVLDLGCGTATLTILLKKAQPEAEIVGLDGDPKVLQIAKAKVTKAGVDISLDYGMAFELPYPDNSFDRVVSSMVLHHLTREDKARTLKEVFRVLKPGGELHVADFGKPQNVLMRFTSLIMRHLEETADLIKGSLPNMFHDAGFEHVEQTNQFMLIFGTFTLYKAPKSTEPSREAAYLEGKSKGISRKNPSPQTMVEKEKYYSLLRTYARIIAPFYDIIFGSFTFGSGSKLRYKVVDFADAPTGSRMLDVATGTGKQAFAFAKKGYDVFGIDLSEDMLQIAKKNNTCKNVKFDRADATNLPFEDNSFAVSCVSLELQK